jgi:hypothetical protein
MRVYDKRDKLQLAEAFKRVIGTIVILSVPLSATALARLLAMRMETIHLRLRYLRSVLDVSENQGSLIRLLHPSFRDFLLDKRRCCDQHFWDAIYQGGCN